MLAVTGTEARSHSPILSRNILRWSGPGPEPDTWYTRPGPQKWIYNPFVQTPTHLPRPWPCSGAVWSILYDVIKPFTIMSCVYLRLVQRLIVCNKIHAQQFLFAAAVILVWINVEGSVNSDPVRYGSGGRWSQTKNPSFHQINSETKNTAL